jgi:hypothetical protein
MRVDRLVGRSLDDFGDSGGGDGDAVTLLFRLPPPALLRGMIANLVLSEEFALEANNRRVRKEVLG